MENMERLDFNFYKGKTVLVTGHTGFKGTWLCHLLLKMGAKVIGYSLEPNTNPNLFELSKLSEKMNSVICDIRDYDSLMKTFKKNNPDIVFHLAAQPIVSESYKDPKYTYETNMLGTLNVLECIRNTESVKSFVNVTTDKVYFNNEKGKPFKEDDKLDGGEPYSNSKSCSELITASYRRSFFQDRDISISTARAGNVIGGGDFSLNRILPDCYRAYESKNTLKLRNPNSVRPYQHVLEALFMYCLIAQKQYGNKKYEGSYNIGPEKSSVIKTIDLVKIAEKTYKELTFEFDASQTFKEAKLLRLDIRKIKHVFGYSQRWDISKAVEKTCVFYKNLSNFDACDLIEKDIDEFLKN